MRNGWLILLFSLSLCSTTLFAQWYESKGVAPIKHGDVETARFNATQQALKHSLLVAGASISSVQQVVNGLLTQDIISIRASGIVNSVSLLNETITDDTVTVSIKADIFPQEKKCFSADYKKAILLTRSNLMHREQANIGKIYDIDTVLVKQLANKIQHQSHYITPQLALKQKTPFRRYNDSIRNESIKQLTTSLASLTDSQFVLYSQINDVSFDTEIQNNWQFWQSDLFNRHIGFSLYVFNGVNGELVYQNSYKNTALWDFDKRDVVDLSSESFWQSDYGDAVDQIITQAVTDLDEHIMCQPTRGKILLVQGNEITVNLGSQQGVKVGDEFSLLHVQNITGDNGKIYAGFNVSPYKVKVISVSAATATAKTIDDRLLGNIQRNDLAIKH